MTPFADRRQLLKLGAAGLVMPLVVPVSAAAADARPAAVVIDSRFPDGPVLAAPGILRLQTDGDVTALWYDHLDLAWRARTGPVAGSTGADVLFVLERLAQDRGRTVLRRKPERSGAVQWLIGMRG